MHPKAKMFSLKHLVYLYLQCLVPTELQLTETQVSNLDISFEKPRACLPVKSQGSHRVTDQITETLIMIGKETSMYVFIHLFWFYRG